MKYSICNIQLLPKAADLRKKAFDEFRLISRLFIYSFFHGMHRLHFLADFQFIPDPLVARAPSLSTEWLAWRQNRKRDDGP